MNTNKRFPMGKIGIFLSLFFGVISLSYANTYPNPVGYVGNVFREKINTLTTPVSYLGYIGNKSTIEEILRNHASPIGFLGGVFREIKTPAFYVEGQLGYYGTKYQSSHPIQTYNSSHIGYAGTQYIEKQANNTLASPVGLFGIQNFKILNTPITRMQENPTLKFNIYDVGNVISNLNAMIQRNIGTSTFMQTILNSEGDPVTLSNGEFTYENTFLKVPSQGMPFEMVLSYKNQLYYDGVVGVNWDHNYNQYLEEEINGNVLYYNGKLGVFRFLKTSNGYEYNEGIQASLLKDAQGLFTLKYDKGNELTFGSDKKIATLKDINGNTLRFEYVNDLLTKVIDTQERIYTYAYNSQNRLSSVTDFSGKKILLSYFSNNSASGSTGDLKDIKTLIKGKQKSVSFEYTILGDQKTNHNITKLIDSKGQTYVENIYDTDRVVTQKFGNGEIHYAYTLSGGIVTENTVTDRENHVTKYEYDDGKNTRMTIMSGSGNQVYEYEYNSLGLISKEKRPRGNGYTFSYDAKGNMIEKRFKTNVDAPESSHDIVTQMTYNSQNKLTSQTDALGNMTSFEYDTFGNLIKITKPLGSQTLETLSEYDTFGNLIKTTDPQGNITTFTYSGANLMQISKLAKDRNGLLGFFEDDEHDLIEKFTYDQYGNILSKIDARGNQTTLTYNEFDNLIASLSPENILSTSVYDANNNVSQTTSGTGENVTTTEYNVLDKPSLITKNIDENLQNSISQEYDKNDNLTKIIFANGSYESYIYNFANKVVEKKTCQESEGISCISTHYEYDTNGNLIKSILPNNTFLTYEYDLFDRLIKETDALGNYKLMVYDNANRITTTQIWNAQNILVNENIFVYDEQNNLLETKIHDLEKNEFYTTTNTYDKLGQVLTMQNALGHQTTFEYDEFQRLLSQEDALGNRVTYEYDKNGNVVKKDILEISGKNTQTQYAYDTDNRLTKETNQLGKEKTYTYNELSQVVSTTDENGNTTHFEYNFAGQVKKQTQYLSGSHITLEFAYDEFGNKISATDENSNTTHFEYDTLQRLVKEVYPDNKNVAYSYDAFGNLATKQDPNGSIVSYVYDNFQRVIEKNITLGTGVVGTTKETFTYDEFGRLSEAKTFESSTLTSTISFTYNALGQLVSETNNTQNVTYVYDALGQLIQTTYPNGKVVTKNYDEIGRVENISNNGNVLVNYSYSGLTLEESGFYNGTHSNFSYDALGRMSGNNTTDGNNSLIKNFTYGYDDVGNILSTGEKNYVYDTLYRLTSEIDSGNTFAQSFVYDNAGNRTDFVFGSGSIGYQSNLLNQYTSLSNSGETTNFVYDNNGNLVEDEKFQYKYDYNNRLVEVVRKAFTREISAGETTSSGTTLEVEESSQNEEIENLSENTTVSETPITPENSASGSENTPESVLENTPENITPQTDSGETLVPEDTQTLPSEGENISPQTDEVIPSSETLSGEIHEVAFFSALEETPQTTLLEETSTGTLEVGTGGENSENMLPEETSSGTEVISDIPTLESSTLESSTPETSQTPEITTELIPDHPYVTFRYDAMGRRFEKEVLNSSGSIVKNISYVYSGEDVIEENSGTEQKTYYYGKDGIDDVIAFQEDDELYFYHKDHLGSIVGITNSSGSLVTSYDYDAYGNFTLSGSDVGNTRLFTGREFDEEIELYYYRARYYSAELGRFISRDPIGIADDINLYAYVGNNPVMYRDPSGEVKQFASDHRSALDEMKNSDSTLLRYNAYAYDFLAGDAIDIAANYDSLSGLEMAGKGVQTFLKPVKVAVKGGQKILGGSYKDVRSNNIGGEVHHVPSNSVSPYSRDKGPGILMSKDDHRDTASWGRGGINYQNKESELIKQGKVAEAFEMGVKDLQSKFGNKYDEGIKQMRSYFYNNLK